MVPRLSASRENTHTPKGTQAGSKTTCIRRGRNRLYEDVWLHSDRLLDGVRRSVASRQET